MQCSESHGSIHYTCGIQVNIALVIQYTILLLIAPMGSYDWLKVTYALFLIKCSHGRCTRHRTEPRLDFGGRKCILCRLRWTWWYVHSLLILVCKTTYRSRFTPTINQPLDPWRPLCPCRHANYLQAAALPGSPERMYINDLSLKMLTSQSNGTTLLRMLSSVQTKIFVRVCRFSSDSLPSRLFFLLIWWGFDIRYSIF